MAKSSDTYASQRYAGSRKLLLLACFVLIAISAVTGSVNSYAKSEYTMGVYFADGYGQDAELKKMVTDIAKVLVTNQEIKITMKWFTDEKEYMTAIKKNDLDFAYSNKHDLLLPSVKKSGYEPFLALGMFGNRENPICLYVARDRNITSSADLKGLTLASYYTREGYYSLRQIFKKPPDAFLGAIVPKHKGREALQMLVAKKVDAAFILRTNYDMLKMMNPTQASSVKNIGCTKDYYDLPFLYSKSVPGVDVGKFSAEMKGIFKHPAMAQHRAIVSTLKLKIIDVSKADYDPIISLYEDAEKNGWEKDYQAWLAKQSGK